MKKNKKESFFWTSYSDLMTSLFFIMLVLFIITIALLHRELVKIDDERDAMRIERDLMRVERDVTQEQLDKIQEIQEATHTIDTNFFKFDAKFNRHTLKNITVSFRPYSYNINDIPQNIRDTLARAGIAIKESMLWAQKNIPEAKFLLIVEGQSSNDGYDYNYELSYQRALALVKFWAKQKIFFDDIL